MQCLIGSWSDEWLWFFLNLPRRVVNHVGDITDMHYFCFPAVKLDAFGRVSIYGQVIPIASRWKIWSCVCARICCGTAGTIFCIACVIINLLLLCCMPGCAFCHTNFRIWQWFSFPHFIGVFLLESGENPEFLAHSKPNFFCLVFCSRLWFCKCCAVVLPITSCFE